MKNILKYIILFKSKYTYLRPLLNNAIIRMQAKRNPNAVE